MQVKKHSESFVCIVTLLSSWKFHHKVKPAWPGAGRTKDLILYPEDFMETKLAKVYY